MYTGGGGSDELLDTRKDSAYLRTCAHTTSAIEEVLSLWDEVFEVRIDRFSSDKEICRHRQGQSRLATHTHRCRE